MESIGFITFDHRILAGMCGNVAEATQAIFVSRVAQNLTAYRLLRSYTGTGEYSNIDCGIVGEILAGYHSVAGIVSEVNYMLDSIGDGELLSVYYRVSWN